MDKRPLHLVYVAILMNLGLFWAAYQLRLPFLAYHTGTVYVTALLGATGGILAAIVTFLALACFYFGSSYAWFLLGGICIATLVGEQLKKETRHKSWAFVTGEIFLIEAFCHILFTISFRYCVPFDILGQPIFYALLPKMNRVFATMIAGTVVSLLTALLTVGCATVCILCTPKRLIVSKEELKKEEAKTKERPLKKKRLQRKKNQD